ncbi:MAG: S9 family peptidase [Bacteroidales bacterium]
MNYQIPSESIVKLVDVTPPPFISLSPDDQWLLILQPPGYPSIADLAKPELRLAGIRFDPTTYGKSKASYFTGLLRINLETLTGHPVTGLPEPLHLERFQWSPDGRYLAFTQNTGTSIELWFIDLTSGTASRIPGALLNDTMPGTRFQWLPDSKSILYCGFPDERGHPPSAPLVPLGPVVQETEGKAAPVRTYQDLLRSPYDEALFDFYCTSPLVRTNLQGKKETILPPAIYLSFSLSPDGQYLLAEKIVKPYSYLVPLDRFACEADIYTAGGKHVRHLSSLPAAEDIPKGFSSVRTGPRGYEWRADVPAELWWVEALDDGDANREAPFRDRLFSLAAPFKGEPIAKYDLELRFDGMEWFSEDIAIVEQSWWDTRRKITARIAPSHPRDSWQVLFDRSFEDAYSDPGNFIVRPARNGKYVLQDDGTGTVFFLSGLGASPEGNRPFIDRIHLPTGKKTRLWQCTGKKYEVPYYLSVKNKLKMIIRRESPSDPPNFFLIDPELGSEHPVTHVEHPYPGLKNIRKEMIRYKRADGINLTGMLYLPYEEEEKNAGLPVLIWAYPQEYKTATAAGQVKDSPFRFSWISWASPLFFLMKGYAILDNPSLPIIGEGDTEPNDTYVEQLVAGAQAAIDKLVSMGVADPEKIAIGGHSYGAFMAANLLAHSRLFAAGIARSGAYNRTLTPFGFQSEERTLWDAPETYIKMSPFMHAHQIKTPLLLIHGEADNNSGTFPMQSERFYAALKGNGGTARLVLLPHENHMYRARESILHMLWEMEKWLEKYL